MTNNKITEDAVEQVAIELLEEQGYLYLTPEYDEWTGKGEDINGNSRT